MKIYHKGFNYSQDGPGNRLVYHMQGCNFGCKWCSNPESMAAYSPSATVISPEDIADEAERSRMFFFDNGGVTFTGGEPTFQFEELKKTLKLLKEKKISTCIETNGSCPCLSELSEYIDFLIMDFKISDNEKHIFYTGCENTNVIANLKHFCSVKRQLHIRIPLINNVNSDADGFLKVFSSVDMTNVTVEVLSYHEFGKEKWTEKYEIEDGFVTAEQLASFKKSIVDAGYHIKDY